MNSLRYLIKNKRNWPVAFLLLLALAVDIPALAANGTNQDSGNINADPFDYRQASLIEARIHSHAGKIPEAMAIFKKLRAKCPQDVELHIEYCTFLLDQHLYDLAQDELTALLLDEPENPQAQRLQARLYMELSRYGWSSALYDRIVGADPNDAIAWSDYAGARLNNTQWAVALANYSRVLELQPENREARNTVYEILKAHGPRLDVGYERYDQMGDETTTDTLSLKWASYLSEYTQLSMALRHMDFSRSDHPFADPMDEEINDGLISLTHRFARLWSVTAGIGGYNGASQNTSFLVGGGVTPFPGFAVNAEYQKNRPWVDPVEAVLYDGVYDRLQLSVDWNDGKRIGVHLEAQDWEYRLDGASPYGHEPVFQGLFSWLLLPEPEIVVGYSYYRAWFDYENDYRPVDMVDDQRWHGIFGSLVHRPWDDWLWGISAGWRYDTIRDLDGWFLQPIVKVFLANRLELDGSYEYSSESTGAVGGETQRFQITARVYF